MKIVTDNLEKQWTPQALWGSFLPTESWYKQVNASLEMFEYTLSCNTLEGGGGGGGGGGGPPPPPNSNIIHCRLAQNLKSRKCKT